MKSATAEANRARNSDTARLAAIVGLSAYGVVHLLIAWLAVQVAIGSPDTAADQKGALAELAKSPIGPVLLWLLAIALVVFALWQGMLAAVGFTWIKAGTKRTVRKIGAVARAVFTIALAVYAIEVAVGSGSSGGGGSSQQEFTAKLMKLPAGRLLVGVVAIGVLVFAVSKIGKGVTKKFMQDLEASKVESWMELLGQIGWTAKGIAFGIVGVLIGLAAIRHDPNQAGGLDKALRTLAQQPFGAVLLVLVALGFAAYGAYCAVVSRAHRT